MDLINKRDDRSVVLHIIAGTILVVVSAAGSYVATHNVNPIQQQAVVIQAQ